MKKCFSKLFFSGAVLSLACPSLASAVCGKIDVGPAYAHIDLQNHGHTEKQLDLPAVRASATIANNQGWCIKPTVLYGKHKGEVTSVSIGFGRCCPLSRSLTISPTIGLGYTDLNADFHPVAKLKAHETFRSISPYICLDFAYTFRPCWRVNGYVQYSYSFCDNHFKTHDPTLIQIFGNRHIKDKSHALGPDFALELEHDISKCWSLNFAVLYKWSLRNRDGIVGRGCKIGIVRWL